MAAAGLELDVQIRRGDAEEGLLGAAGSRLLEHRQQVCEVLVRYGLTNPRVFGSVARGEDTASSDVDLLVDVADGIGLFDM